MALTPSCEAHRRPPTCPPRLARPPCPAGRKLRCVGSGLSPNGLGFNEQGMVSLTLMDSILSGLIANIIILAPVLLVAAFITRKRR